MKKFWVLFSLFILPLVFYIFLSKGIYKYAGLPILTEQVIDPITLVNTEFTLKDKITVLCFLGNKMETGKGSMFNLNQTIYKRFYQKPYFQIVVLLPKGTEADYNKALEELSTYTKTTNWKFVYADEQRIKTIYNSLETASGLNENLYTEKCFIIDRELRQRGRKDDEDTKGGILYGYNMQSVAELKNKMIDDINIIYYQLKKEAEKESSKRKNKITK